MYTNIDTNHALVVPEEFFHYSPFAHGVNSCTCLDVICIIMRHNILHFGGTTWKSKMVLLWVPHQHWPMLSLYFLIHELNFVQQFSQLNFYVRYLDNIFVICHPNSYFTQDSTYWSSLQESFNSFGNLLWNFEECSKTVTFLDLEIHLDLNGQLYMDIYEKELNIYLYLLLHSSHSPGFLCSLVNGYNLDLSLASDPFAYFYLLPKVHKTP